MWHEKSKSFCYSKVFHIHQEKRRDLLEESGILPYFDHPEELKTSRWLRGSCPSLESMTVNFLFPTLHNEQITSLRRQHIHAFPYSTSFWDQNYYC